MTHTLAVKREAVNRALVDFQNSIVAERLAAVAAQGARTSRGRRPSSGKGAEVVRRIRRQRVPPGTGWHDARLHLLRRPAEGARPGRRSRPRPAQQQRRTIEQLKIARNQKANRAAAAEASRLQASSAVRSAASRRGEAISAVKTAQQAMADQQRQKAALLTKRAQSQNSSTSCGGEHAGRRTGDPGLSAFTDGPDVTDAAMAAAAAAAKIAVDIAQKTLAAVIGSQQIPQSKLFDELGLSGSDVTSSSGDNGSLSRLSSGSPGPCSVARAASAAAVRSDPVFAVRKPSSWSSTVGCRN